MKKGTTYIYESDDFRIVSRETAKNAQGETVIMTLCEDLVEGRWEPFYSVRKAKKA